MQSSFNEGYNWNKFSLKKEEMSKIERDADVRVEELEIDGERETNGK